MTRFLVLLFVMSLPAYANEMEKIEERLLRLEEATIQQKTAVKLSAFFQLDGAIYKTNTDLEQSKRTEFEDGLLFRRARFEARGAAASNLSYSVEINFTGNEISILKAYLDLYSHFGKFRLGHTKRPSSQAFLRSSSDLSFLERPMGAEAIAPDRGQGLTHFIRLQDRFFMMTGVYSGAANDDRDADVKSPFSIGTRFGGDLWRSDKDFIQLASSHLKQTSADKQRFRTDLSSRVSRERLLDTEKLNDTNQYNYHSADLQMSFNSFRLIAEVMTLRLVNRKNLPDASSDFTATSLEIGYAFNGERREFDDEVGVFEGFNPVFAVDNGGYGAFEVVGRLATLDLNTETGVAQVQGGKGVTYSLALNWVPKNGLSFIAEGSQMEVSERPSNRPDETIKVLQGRAQVSF